MDARQTSLRDAKKALEHARREHLDLHTGESGDNWLVLSYIDNAIEETDRAITLADKMRG